MSRIAKGSKNPLFNTKRSRTIAKGDGLLHFGWKAIMRKPVDIDSKHSRAIVREIGNGLRESVKEDKDVPASFKSQIERLRESEAEPQSRPDQTRDRSRD